MVDSASKRRLLSDEPEIVDAKHVRGKDAENTFQDLRELMELEWGQKNKWGFKESYVKTDWGKDFYDTYEAVFGRREVTNRHVPEYFVRAFALSLYGRKINWDSFKDLAKELSKSAKDSSLIEASKCTSSKCLKQHVRYSDEELQAMQDVFEDSLRSLDQLRQSLDGLHVRRREVQERLLKLEGRKEAHEEDLTFIENELKNAEALVSKEDLVSREDVCNLKSKVDDALRDRSRKQEQLNKISEPLINAQTTLAEIDIQIRGRKQNILEEEGCCNRIEGLCKFLESSAPLNLQPVPLRDTSCGESKTTTFTSCIFCYHGFNSSDVVVLAPCLHAYHLLCLSYSASSGIQCQIGCQWDANMSAAMGLQNSGMYLIIS